MRELVHQMQGTLEGHFHKAFSRYVFALRNSPTLAQAAARARDDDTDSLMDHFRPFIAKLGEERRRMAAHATLITIKELRGKLMRKADGEDDGAGDLTSTVGLSFDPELAAAADLMAEADLDFIAEFTDSQREAVRRALVTALRQGKGTQSVARAFRNSIGLTAFQQDAVDNYRGLLENNSAMALDRVLRDRRYDPGLTDALVADEPLSDARIDAMVDRYASRYLAYRAETIARTETTRVLNQARQQGTEEVVASADIPEDDVVRTWSAVQDNRTRDTHAEMDGQERGLNEPFDSPSGAQLMYPGDPSAPADEVINCRCAVLISFKSGAPTAEVATDDAG
jgi:hypothetical protein